jgi:hypothetical protein
MWALPASSALILSLASAPRPLPPDVVGKWVCECRAGTWPMNFRPDGTVDLSYPNDRPRVVGRWWMKDRVLHILQRHDTWHNNFPDDHWDVYLYRSGPFLYGESSLYDTIRLRRVR